MSNETTELFVLLNSNKLDALKKRLTKKNVDVRGAADQTLLHDAVLSGNIDAVSLLLALDANVNAVNSEGDTALIVAASRYNYEMVKLLLKAGADANIKGRKGMTAIRWAVGDPSGDFRLIRVLLKHGADPWIKNDAGGDAVTVAETIFPDLAEEMKRVSPKR